jgi:hypothetical protein
MSGQLCGRLCVARPSSKSSTMSVEDIVQPTGNIEIHVLGADEVLFLPGARWKVESGYTFEFRPNGNFEVRNPAKVLVWESATGDLGATKLALQPNGNLLICAGVDPVPLWQSGTAGNPGAFIAFQQDGNFVVYGRDTHPLWASDTVGK